MDFERIAALIAECDDDNELVEVYRMMPGNLQRKFRDDIMTITVKMQLAEPKLSPKMIEALARAEARKAQRQPPTT